MNITSSFRPVLLLFLLGFSVLKSTKNRSDYLSELLALRVPGIPAVHSFQSMPYVPDDNISSGVRELLLDEVDYLDGEILNKFFRLFKSAQKERSLDCQSLGQAVLQGLCEGCSGQMIFLFKPEMAEKFSSHIIESEMLVQREAMIQMFNDIVINKNVSQFCNFLQFCQHIKKIELQGMTGRQYAGNLGRLFIEVLLREFFKTRNIEGIDRMACSLLGFCNDVSVRPFSFQDDVFSNLRDYFLLKIQGPNFLSLEFPAEAAKLASAFSSTKKPHTCFTCQSPLILFAASLKCCKTEGYYHPYCINRGNSGNCHFCRQVLKLSLINPDLIPDQTTLPEISVRPPSGTVARPNPKNATRRASSGHHRSPSPARMGFSGVKSRQGRGLPTVGPR